MRRAALVVALVAGLAGLAGLAGIARGDEPDPATYAPQALPPCRSFALAGEEACAYRTIEEVRALYLADVELVERRATEPLLRRQIAALTEAHRQAAARADAEAVARAALEERRAVLVTSYLDLDRRYQAERVRPRIGGRWGWTVAAALGATLLVVVAHDALE